MRTRIATLGRRDRPHRLIVFIGRVSAAVAPALYCSPAICRHLPAAMAQSHAFGMLTAAVTFAPGATHMYAAQASATRKSYNTSSMPCRNSPNLKISSGTGEPQVPSPPTPWAGISIVPGMHSPPGIYDLPAFSPSGVCNYSTSTPPGAAVPLPRCSTCVELKRVMKTQLLHAHMRSLWVVGAEGERNE